MANNDERARAAQQAAHALGDMLYEKQMAYGDAGGIQRAIWQALLKQYEAPNEISATLPNGSTLVFSYPESAGFYAMPRELMDHIPRLTRVFDRICRIVSNPTSDRLGEDPWRDLAGDAIIGMIMPRTQPQPQRCATPDCEVTGPHLLHGRVHAGGVQWWGDDGHAGGLPWGDVLRRQRGAHAYGEGPESGGEEDVPATAQGEG